MTAIPDTIKLPDGTCIPVIPPEKAQESDSSEVLKEVADSMGKEAIAEAFRNGLPVTIGKDGKIIRRYPDGREEIIGTLPQ